MKRILVLLLVFLMLLPSVAVADTNISEMISLYSEKLAGTWMIDSEWYSFKGFPTQFIYSTTDQNADFDMELFIDTSGKAYLVYLTSLTNTAVEVMFGVDENRILLYKDGTAFPYVRQ